MTPFASRCLSVPAPKAVHSASGISFPCAPKASSMAASHCASRSRWAAVLSGITTSTRGPPPSSSVATLTSVVTPPMISSSWLVEPL